MTREDRKRAGSPSPEDFARWETRARAMGAEALRWSMKDAQEASWCLRDRPQSNWYSDEAATYGQELRRRGYRV